MKIPKFEIIIFTQIDLNRSQKNERIKLQFSELDLC